MLSERLGRWAFWLMFVGFNVAFLPMHVTGLIGMPRRVYTYPSEPGLNSLNLVTSIFSFVFAAGVLVVIVDLVRHLRRGPEAGTNPWAAWSLDWMQSRLPHNFRSIMPITSRYPLWDQPGLKEDEMAGRGFLPDAPTREREALITSPITTEPVQILRVPGPSWTAILASLATALGLAAATLKAQNIAALIGIVAIAAFLYWLWSLDRALPREPADAGRGLALPLYRNGSDSVGWWGMVVLLVADAAVIAAFLFAYLFLWTAHPQPWPPDGSAVPGFVEPVAIGGLTLVAWALFEAADRLIGRDRRLGAAACFVASAVVAAAAVYLGWTWLDSLGIDPTRHSYGAAVWTLAGAVALHVAGGAGMALWCLLRLALGMIDSWRCLTVRVCLLWWRLTAPMTVVVLFLIVGFPYVFR